MSNATSTPGTATALLPLPFRRRLLAGSGLATLAAARAVPTVVPPVHAASADPVTALYAEWRCLEDKLAAVPCERLALSLFNDVLGRASA